MLQVSVVSETAEFIALRDEWSSLVERSTTATVFDTFDWASTWWKVIGSRSLTITLHVLVMRDHGGLIRGIVPLCRSRFCVPGMTRLTFIGGRLSDYHDAIASDGDEAEVVDSFYSYMEQCGRGLTADLGHLKDSGNLMRYSVQNKSYLTTTLIRQEECPYLLLPALEAERSERWEELLKTFSKKLRSNIRYYDRALDRIYAVDRVVASTEDEVRQGIEALFTLHQRRWNKRGLPGVFVNRSVRRFHLHVAASLLRKGQLRLHLLKLDGGIEAVLYCFLFNGVTSYYQGGFEPALAKRSLGSVLTGLAIRRACEDGCREFDFLRGFESYKAKWVGSNYVWTNRILIGRKDSIFFPYLAASARASSALERKFKQIIERML